MNMRGIALLLWMLLLGVTSMQAQEVSHEITIDGERQPLKTLTKLTFDGDKAVMHFTENEQTQQVDMTKLNVSFFKYGDVNGDGRVSITDAVGVVNNILNNSSETFDPAAADVNRDTRITITDAVGVVNIILNQR